MKILRYKGLSLFPRQVRANRGGVLIMVLWALFFLAALSLAVNSYVRPQIRLAVRLKTKAEADYAAQAVVQRAMSFIIDQTQEADALNDLWADTKKNDLKYGFIDEERKININTASMDILKRLLQTQAGLKSEEAEPLAQAIVQKKKNFEVLQEILLVKDMTGDIFDKIKDSITVYGSGVININTVDQIVMQCLGLSISLADKIIRFRNGGDGKPGTEDDNVILTANNMVNLIDSQQSLTQEETAQLTNMVAANAFGVRSNHFMGIAQGLSQGGVETTQVTFVCDRHKNILFWQET